MYFRKFSFSLALIKDKRLSLAVAVVTLGGLTLGGPGYAASFDLNLEYRQLTDINPPFSRRVYICSANCPAATEWDAQSPEPGWQLAPARVRLFDSGVVAGLPTPPPGVPATLNFNGATLFYGADVVDVTPMPSASGFFATARVARDNALIYDAGNVVHELTNAVGERYVAFTAEIGVHEAVDLAALGALADFIFPAGWEYSSRILTDELRVESDGLAHIFVHPQISFQRYAAVPLPAAGYLFGAAVVGLMSRRRCRS